MLGPGVDLPGGALGSGALRSASDAEDLELLPLGSRFEVGGAPFELTVPGAPQRAQRARRAGGLPRGGRRAGRGGAGAARLRRRRPALRGPRPHAPRARASSTTTPTIRPRCAPRSTRRATLRPRRLVACFQPHLYSRTAQAGARVRPGAGAGRRGGGARRLPRARARRGLPGRVRPARWRRRRPTPRGGRPVWWLPALDEAERRLRDELREGDVLLTLGAGDVDDAGPEARGGVTRARGRRARLPARPPDHHPHRRPRRLVRARGLRRAAGRAPRLGGARGARGRSGGLGIEPAGSR